VADGTTSTLITAVVKDMDGNNIDDGTKVEFATTGGTLSGTSATTTNGEATVTLTSPTTIGSADITATVGKISGSTKVDFIAGPVTTLTLSASPNTLPADGTSTSTIQITAKDINGNPVADESIGLTASSGSLSAASAKTDESGVATITYTAPGIVPEGGTVTVTATTNNITSTTVITINQVPPWDVWPDPQWCPKTGSMHFIDYPDEKPSRIYCYYYADGTLKIEEPKFMFKVSDTYYNRWYGIFKTYYQNGNLERFITYDISGTESIKDGTETWYYENGNVYYESSWKNDILDGAVKKYAEDGTITMSSYYHNGQKDGKETLWDDKHIKVSETNYKDGKKDGLQTIYDSNGNIESETYYTQDVKNGAEKLYYSTTGIVKAEYNYSNGKFDGLQKSYNSDGSNSSETRFTDGVRNGIQKFYSATGIMESEVNYTNGEKDGIEILYNPSSGKVEEKIPWEMGLRNHNGVHELYYANGQLRLKTPYNSAGEVDGVVTEYYENGVIKRTQPYKSGELDGQVKEYDDNGEMTDCSEYADGQYIKSCMPEK
jgi:antitoxin component YwqK of YwqJK toxin-antitoxin module